MFSDFALSTTLVNCIIKRPQRDALVYSTKSLPVVPKDDEATNYSNTDSSMIEFRDWRKQNDRGRHRDIRQPSCGCSAEL